MHADELADLLRWCAALSTDPADLAGEVMVAVDQRWSALVDSPADLRELTVRTFLQTTQVPDLDSQICVGADLPARTFNIANSPT